MSALALLLLVLLLFCSSSYSGWTVNSVGDIAVSVDIWNGEWNIAIGDEVWFEGGRSALHCNDKWYTTQEQLREYGDDPPKATARLKWIAAHELQGGDSFGSFRGLNIRCRNVWSN